MGTSQWVSYLCLLVAAMAYVVVLLRASKVAGLVATGATIGALLALTVSLVFRTL